MAVTVVLGDMFVPVFGNKRWREDGLTPKRLDTRGTEGPVRNFSQHGVNIHLKVSNIFVSHVLKVLKQTNCKCNFCAWKHLVSSLFYLAPATFAVSCCYCSNLLIYKVLNLLFKTIKCYCENDTLNMALSQCCVMKRLIALLSAACCKRPSWSPALVKC